MGRESAFGCAAGWYWPGAKGALCVKKNLNPRRASKLEGCLCLFLHAKCVATWMALSTWLRENYPSERREWCYYPAGRRCFFKSGCRRVTTQQGVGVFFKPGCRRQAFVSWVLFEGALAGSVTKWPLRGREKCMTPSPPSKHSRPLYITKDAATCWPCC